MTEKLQRWDVGEEGSWHDENGDWCASPDVSELESRVEAFESFVRYVAENDHIRPMELSVRAHDLLNR